MNLSSNVRVFALAVAGVLLLPACSVFTQPPRKDAAEIQADIDQQRERAAWTRDRQKVYQASGASAEDARRQAEVDVHNARMSGRSNVHPKR